MIVKSISVGIAGVLTALLAIAAVPATASAQFASGLTPPPRPVPPAVAAAAESTVVAKRDSVAREQRLDMKAWVDSAASSLERGGVPVAPIPLTPGDTVPPLPPVPPLPASPAPRPTTLPDSSRRPVTRPPSKRPPATVSIRPSAPGITPPDAPTSAPLLASVGAGLCGSGLVPLRPNG